MDEESKRENYLYNINGLVCIIPLAALKKEKGKASFRNIGKPGSLLT